MPNWAVRIASARLKERLSRVHMVQMVIRKATMLVAKVMVTTSPEVVTELSAFMQIGLPTVSVWQMMPGAHREDGVVVALQVLDPDDAPVVK